eukprot:5304802-Amphidinium_carterae.1
MLRKLIGLKLHSEDSFGSPIGKVGSHCRDGIGENGSDLDARTTLRLYCIEHFASTWVELLPNAL